MPFIPVKRISKRNQIVIYPLKLYISLVISITFTFVIHAGDIEIAQWPFFKNAAVSITLDDNLPGQFTYALPALAKRDIQATFFTITQTADWNMICRASAEGHEIGSHTKTHADMTSGGISLLDELKRSKNEIQAHIAPQHCVSFAWPFSHSDRTLYEYLDKYYIAGRSWRQGIENASPEDMFTVNSIDMDKAPAADLQKQIDTLRMRAGWLVLLYHEIGPDALETDPALFAQHLDILNANRADFWIAPFGSVAQYVQERQALNAAVIRTTSSAMTIYLQNTLEIASGPIPLTMKVKLPSGWNQVTVCQKGLILPHRFNSGHIEFEGAPLTGEITIFRQLESTSIAASPAVSKMKHIGTGISNKPVQLTGQSIQGALFNSSGTIVIPKSSQNTYHHFLF